MPYDSVDDKCLRGLTVIALAHLAIWDVLFIRKGAWQLVQIVVGVRTDERKITTMSISIRIAASTSRTDIQSTPMRAKR